MRGKSVNTAEKDSLLSAVDGGSLLDLASKKDPERKFNVSTVIMSVIWVSILGLLIALIVWNSLNTSRCPNILVQNLTLVGMKSPGRSLRPILFQASTYTPLLAVQPVGSNITLQYTVCTGDSRVKCLLDREVDGVFFLVTWGDLFPNTTQCATQTTSSYFQVVHTVPQPVIIMYCGSNSQKAFAELCLNLHKTTDGVLSPPDEKIVTFQEEKAKKRQQKINGTFAPISKNHRGDNEENVNDPEDGFAYSSLHPLQTGVTEFFVEFPTPVLPFPSLAYCAQTFNFQLTNFTISICYVSKSTGKTICLPSEDVKNANEMVRVIPEPVGLDTSVVKVVWTNVEAKTRILVGVVGKEEMVRQICNF